MPAKPLTAEQQQDAKRLAQAFKRFQQRQKDAGLPSSQDALAQRFDLGQSALNQYLKGKIPLNGPFLKVFCDVTGENPDEISPAVATKEREYAKKWIPQHDVIVEEDEFILRMLGRAVLSRLSQLQEEKRNAVLINLHMSLGLEPAPELLGKDHQEVRSPQLLLGTK